MLPLTTERLVLRDMRPDDAARVAAYRNDPEVARYQDWALPYTEQMFMESMAARGDAPFETRLATGTNLAIEADGRPVGDVYVQVNDGLGEVGWTLALDARGHGYATEAAAALLHLLFTELGAHRVEASMHPDNVASARVCEAIGMTFEVWTKQNFRGRDGWEDDVRYAVLRSEWEAWTSRPLHPPTDVSLVEITPDDAYLWARLVTHKSQEAFVAPTRVSYADALFPEVIDGAPVVPWLRGVMADGERVAFVMMAEVTEHHPYPYLWRLLIDRMHQRRGIGKRIIELLVAHVRAQGHDSLVTSYEVGPGGPAPFYHRMGFVATGEIIDGEIETKLTLAS
ncbi:MAG: GNAT family N-acetyltransferase [Actinomycetota bacterium]|nr:GNAT family N-acetyltransferase [Actinomycetota bacterium]